jgi:HlyD family secretion protein
MKQQYLIIALALTLLSACGNKDEASVAHGTFEATETTVSAEQSGKLVRFCVTEGQVLEAGQEVGLVDTVPLQLKLAQLGATRDVFAAQRPDISAQLAATQQQLVKAQLELRRYTELVNDGAAPRKMLDDARSQVLVLQKQLEAQRSSLGTQTATLNSQQKATDTERSQLLDLISKCHITAPAKGTVLEKYAEPGEVTAAGKPLFKLADTEHMFLRAYVTSAQLADVKLGQQVKVSTDYGDNLGKTYDGTVTWISSKSEFTPKSIPTSDERADLVYAVKIAVRNDGYIKIGMYGQVVLKTAK